MGVWSAPIEWSGLIVSAWSVSVVYRDDAFGCRWMVSQFILNNVFCVLKLLVARFDCSDGAV